MKLKMKILMLMCVVFSSVRGQQKDSLSYKSMYTINENLQFEYSKTTFFEMFKNIPDNVYQFGKYTIQSENLLQVGAAVGSTLVLLPLDQKIIENSTELGEKIGWVGDGSYVKASGVRLFPKDINTAVYYVGNGGFSLLIGGGLYAFGKINKDYRAVSTASQIVESLLSVGVLTQTIKRISGRETPNTAEISGVNGGNWRPFPSFSEYQSNTPIYDAMPSGHVATFMATFTVLTQNYPEVKWIKPVGYTLMTALAFQMMSSKVHWASDYPIAVLIGYVIGKTTANRRIKKHDSRTTTFGEKRTAYDFNYNFSKIGNYTLVGVNIRF